jgi:hypothetical protein
MAVTITSKSIDLSSWITLYTIMNNLFIFLILPEMQNSVYRIIMFWMRFKVLTVMMLVFWVVMLCVDL